MAAACSASFFVRPVPVPSASPSISAAHEKWRACAGPWTSVTTYATLRPVFASASCSSVLWSTCVVRAYSIRSEKAATIAGAIVSYPCSR